MSRLMTIHGFALVVALLQGTAAAAPVRDDLDLPAQPTRLATKSPLLSITSAGDRLIAVGQRGHIVTSGDNGASWVQSTVPVSSDLTAVHFVSPSRGWAVGHDGVVLTSSDGGLTWLKQFDGNMANRVLVEALESKRAKGQARAEDDALLEEAKRYAAQGADKPFLDVWFIDERNGFVVGAFGLVFRTSDGGKSWESWFDRIDNPQFLHLYAVRQIGHQVFIAGEGGSLFRLDRGRFTALPSPYNGSFFGIIGNDKVMVAYGLRGNVFRSADAGKTWRQLQTGTPASIVGATLAGDGSLLFASQAGQFFRSDAEGEGLARVQVQLERPMPPAGIQHVAPGVLALVGTRGVTTARLTSSSQAGQGNEK